MRIQYAIPESAVSADVLDAALETSTRANEALFAGDQIPLLSTLIRRGQVKWKPEPYGDGEHFDLAHQIGPRGWADCDDLAPYLAAELRATGKDPGATAIARRSGPKRWHAVVLKSDGQILDPSVWAGMLKHRQPPGVQGAINRALTEPGGGAIGIREYHGRVAARCDLPIDGTDLFVCGVAVGSLENAMAGAFDIAGYAGELSEAVDPEVWARAHAIRQLMAGVDEDEICGELQDGGYDVGFLPLAAALAPQALDMAKGLMPGGKGKGKGAGGAPAALTASHPGGGAPITVTPYTAAPGAPIIVRF